jgi:hypothetical protein
MCKFNSVDNPEEFDGSTKQTKEATFDAMKT